MRKDEFLTILRDRLKKHNAYDINDAVNYYDELLLDLIADGKSEEEAVALMGDIDEIVMQISHDIKKKSSLNGVLKNVLIVIGICFSPALLPLAIVLVVLYLILFVVALSFIVAFGAPTIALAISSVAIFFIQPNIGAALMFSALAIVLTIGFAFITYYLTKNCIKLIRLLTLKINSGLKKLTKKGENNNENL